MSDAELGLLVRVSMFLSVRGTLHTWLKNVFMEEDDDDDEGEDRTTEAGGLPKLNMFCLWWVACEMVIGSEDVFNGMCVGC